MKIILFSQQFPNNQMPYRGVFNFSAIKALKKKGIEVIVIAPLNLTPLKNLIFPYPNIRSIIRYYKKLSKIPSETEYLDIRVYYVRTINFTNKFLWQFNHYFLKKTSEEKIKRIVKDFKPDLIISSFINPCSFYIKYIRNFYKGKVFSLMIGSDVLIHPDKYIGWKHLEFLLNKYVDMNICVSNNMLKFVRENRNIENLTVIHNGYDENKYFFKNKEFKKNKILSLISVGSFYYTKGHDLLLGALEFLNFDFRLSLVGEGPLETLYKEMVKIQRLEKKVFFKGRIKNLREELIKHDFFILPSRSEGMPIAPLEAMACGLPVIANNVGGVSEIVQNGFNGYLIDELSSRNLAKAINLAFENYDNWDRSKLSINVKKEFSWTVWVNKIEALYYSNSK